MLQMVMEESQEASTGLAERVSLPKMDSPAGICLAGKDEQQQQQQANDQCGANHKLPGRVVLGPPAFVEKLNRFKSQGPSRLGKLMKHATKVDAVSEEACA